MFTFAKRTARRVLENFFPRWLNRLEYDRQSFLRFNEKYVEYRFVYDKLAALYPREVLDVGTGLTALPHSMRNAGSLVTATDNVRDYWPAGMVNRHYHVLNDDIRKTRLTGSYDLITCITVLHHIPEADDAVRNLFSLLKPGGHLILTFPYTERSYVPNVYELPGSSYGQNEPYITQSFSRKELDRWTQDHGATILDQEYWQFWEGEHWTVGAQMIPPQQRSAEDRHQFTCLLLRKD